MTNRLTVLPVYLQHFYSVETMQKLNAGTGDRSHRTAREQPMTCWPFFYS